MSKRAGTVVTLEDLVERDRRRRRAVRAGPLLGRLARSTSTSTLLTRQTNDNPVFYVQYAHARICLAAAQRRRARASTWATPATSTPRCWRTRARATCSGAGRVPAGGRAAPPSCASRTGSRATWRSWPAPTTGSTTPAGCCRGATRRPTAADRARLWLCEATRIVLANGLRPARRHRARADVSVRDPRAGAAARRRLTPAARPPARPAGRPRTRSTRRLAALGASGTTARCTSAAWRQRAGRRARHPGCTCSTRPTSAAAPRDFARRVRRRRRLLRRQGVPLQRGRPLGRRGGPRPGRLHRRRARRRAARRVPRRADRVARQQQVASPSSRRPSTPASAGSSSTPSTRSTGCAAGRARRAACASRCWSASTVGVEAHTHEFIATAHEDQKFGFSLAGGDALTEAVRRVLDAPALRAGRPALPHRLADLRHRRLRGRGAPRGRAARPDARRARRRAAASSTSAAASASPTPPSDDPVDSPSVAAQLRAIVAARVRGAGLPVPRLAVEPGRAIAGPGTRHALRGRHRQAVGSTAAAPATYCRVDGGMSDNIRTALYDAELHLRAGLPQLATPRRCWPGGRQALRERRHRGPRRLAARPTSRPATCSRSPPPAPTAGRWPATTTTCRARRWSRCGTARHA